MAWRSSSLKLSRPATFKASVIIGNVMVCAPVACILPHRTPGKSVAPKPSPVKRAMKRRRVSVSSLFFIQVHRLCAPVIDAVKQKLERPLRLAAIGDFGTEHEELALSNLGIHNSDGVFEVTLAPSPATPQWLIRVEPGYWLHAFRLRIGLELERG